MQKFHEEESAKNKKDNGLVSDKRYVDIKFLSSYISFKVPTIRDWVEIREKIKFHKISNGAAYVLIYKKLMNG